MEGKDFDISKFIEFVVDLVQEDDYFLNFWSAKEYFFNGGCYQLYKVVKNYFPDASCMVKDDGNGFDHCAILYKDKLYDANGELFDRENYRNITEIDINYMEECFGLGERVKSLESDSIISEIEKCNIKGSYYK